MTETYEERVARYRIVRHEVISDPRRRAQYMINGLNPDEVITLVWSFDDKAAAERRLDQCREIDDRVAAKYGPIDWHHYIIDNGEAEVITREAWF